MVNRAYWLLYFEGWFNLDGLSWGNEGRGMILAPLAAAALVVSAATGPTVEPNGPPVHLSMQQKNAAMQPLVRSTTECIARTVAADPRFHKLAPTEGLGDLIVDSVPPCLGLVRAMIDAYDRYFGDGTGEAFFMGPYLDILPTAVNKWVADSAE